MNDSSSDFARIVERCQSGIAGIFGQPCTAPERAGTLADLLGECVPQAVRTACLLIGEDSTCLEVRPQEGANATQEILLQSLIPLFPPGVTDVRAFALEPWPSLQVLGKPIHTDERLRGFLLIGLDAASIEGQAAWTRIVLSVAGVETALHWTLELLRREEGELARFALVGQAFAGLAHDLNNALNSMMLQTSVVQLRVDPETRQDLAAIRQHGSQAAGLVRSLQHVVQERRERSYPVDLDGVLMEVLHESPELHRRVSPQLSKQSPRIASTRSAVKQLVRLLLEGVCAGTRASVNAATGEQEGPTVLTLTIADTTQGDAPSLETMLWQNLDEVGRQAGLSLLRQLNGTATAERGDYGTPFLRIIWMQNP